ncbi:MAG: class I SAM-dependent methyltransferase [Planctomycetes bacterium]|nr:class I SAM-dependent methyltransferase [Planctomycetota bacterium]
MFERILDGLPEMARAARRLYDPDSGGYHLPTREDQQPFGLADVERMWAVHTTLQYDCIETPVADLLASLVVNTRARTILETGTSRGFSTAHLAAAARAVHGDSARVVTLDAEAVPNRFFEGSDLARSIDARGVDSLSVDPTELAGSEAFDFLFLDALRSYRHVADEVARFLPRLKVGGLFVLHDTFGFDGLGLVVLQLMQHPALEVVSLPTHRPSVPARRTPGVTILRKVAEVLPGSLVLPGRGPDLEREMINVVEWPTLVQAIGSGALRPTYVAGHQSADQTRSSRSAPLLAPAGSAPTPAPVTVDASAAADAVPASAPLLRDLPAANAATAPGLPDAVFRQLQRLTPAMRPASSPAVAPTVTTPAETPTRGAPASNLRVRAFKAQAAGDTDKAVALLQSALAVSPGDPDVICDLASLALATGEPVPAVTLARRALDVAPDHPVALFTLGMALAQGGAAAPAIRALQRVADGEGAAALRAQAGALADQVAPMLAQLRARQAA